jgi:hypothetical protein
LRRTAARSRIVDVTRLFKLALAAVFLLTLAAPPAGAQGDDLSGLGWAVLVGSVAIVLVLVAGATVLGVGLDYVIPDAPFKLAEENVNILLSAGRVRVSAEYVFQNDGDKDKVFALRYPFGRGRGVGPAKDVTVKDPAGAEIPFERKNKSMNFDVTVPAKTKTTVAVTYEQPVSGTHFTYFLGKDRFWGLDGAFTTFSVTAPAAFGTVTSTYPLKRVSAEAGATGYVFVRDDFYPQMNFALTWEKAAAGEP